MSDMQKFTVRMPKELYDRLKLYAEESYIPMSRLVLIAVDQYLESNQDKPKETEQS